MQIKEAWRRSTPLGRGVFLAAALAATLYGGAKPSGGSAPRRQRAARTAQSSMRAAAGDERAYTLVSIETAADVNYAKPAGAASYFPWTAHGAFEDWTSVDFADKSYCAFTGGCLKDAPRDDASRIGLDTDYLLAVPGQSELWWQETENERVVTWNDFAERGSTNATVNVQIRFTRDGSAYTVCSNDTVYAYHEIYDPAKDPTLVVSLEAPRGVLRNGSAREIRASVFSSRPSLDGTLTLRCLAGDDRITLYDDAALSHPTVLPMTVTLDGGGEIVLYAAYAATSGAVDDIVLEAEVANDLAPVPTGTCTAQARLTAAKATALELRAPAAGTSARFPADETTIIDFTNSANPGNHLLVPFARVATALGTSGGYTVDASVAFEPADYRELVSWNADLALTNVSVAATSLVGPRDGGLYTVSASTDGLSFDGYVLLPPAGAGVDASLHANLAAADAFATAAHDLLPRRWLARAIFGGLVFGLGPTGYYKGRPDAAANPTVWHYNQVNDETGLGAVCTLAGTPIRLEKLSNLIAGYACQKMGVTAGEQDLSQALGTPNGPSADLSWQAGVALGNGADEAVTFANCAAGCWATHDDPGKTDILWPNPEPNDNYRESAWRHDYNREWFAPGFLSVNPAYFAAAAAVGEEFLDGVIPLGLDDDASELDGLFEDWTSGAQTNVLAAAEARLAANPDDLTGLLLKASYDFDFADAATLSNSLCRVLDAGAAVTNNAAFAARFEMTRRQIAATLAVLETETDEEHAADVGKARQAGLPIPFAAELRTLEN